MPDTLQDAIRDIEPSDLLVKGDNGLWRFPEDEPDFAHVVQLWALAAEHRFDVATLDWQSLAPRVRRLMVSVAAPWPWRRADQLEPDGPIVVAANDEEVIGLVRGLATGAIAPDFVDWDAMSDSLRTVVWVLSRYEIRRLRSLDTDRRRGLPQKRAMRLLRSLLTDSQRWWLRHRRHFLVNGVSTGHVYRLHPYSGTIDRVTKHRTRWFVHTRFCLHDPDIELPPADVSVGHLLLLRSDEPRFLALANATDGRSMFWNGDWLRRVNRARRDRHAALSTQDNVDRQAMRDGAEEAWAPGSVLPVPSGELVA